MSTLSNLINRSITGNFDSISYRKSLDTTLYPHSQVIRGAKGCINTLSLSSDETLLASGGDDCIVRVYNSYAPLYHSSIQLKGHSSNIFCAVFAPKDPGHSEALTTYTGHSSAVYRVSFIDPYCFISGSQDNTIKRWDIRQNGETNTWNFTYAINALDTIDSYYISSGDKLLLHDFRKEGIVIDYETNKETLGVSFRKDRDVITAVQSHDFPLLFNIWEPHPLAVLTAEGYSNGTTMKSVIFGGINDQYVITGGDDFRLYFWEIPSILSLISNDIPLVSHAITPLSRIYAAGVEKVIRILQPFEFESELEVYSELAPRTPFTHHESIDEDIYTLAQFDLLIEAEASLLSNRVSSDDEFSFHVNEGGFLLMFPFGDMVTFWDNDSDGADSQGADSQSEDEPPPSDSEVKESKSPDETPSSTGNTTDRKEDSKENTPQFDAGRRGSGRRGRRRSSRHSRRRH